MTNIYLNEEKYKRTKHKIKIIAILVLIIGILLGGGLIITGIIKNNQAKLSTQEINKVQTEIDDFNSQLSSLKSQKHQEFRNNGFSENYYNLENQILKIEDNIFELEDKLEPDTSHLFVFYMFGGFIIIVTLMISGIIYSTAKRREIAAFGVQQMMPIAQEGLEKIAPTIGKAGASIAKEMAPAYSEVAKEIAKGIKEGLKDE